MSRKAKKLILVFGLDLVLLGVALCLFALFHHVLPRSLGNYYGTSMPDGELADWTEKFPDKFTADGAVEQGENFYRDGNVSVTLTTGETDGAVWHLADIYVKNVTYLRTAMALTDEGEVTADSTLNLSRENDALVAVSGDYFGIRERSVVIRNGQVYRKTRAHQICVLYYDGTLETYPFASFDVEMAIAGGAWQAWDFGPALLDKDGKAITEFQTGISGPNPRIAIGYYEPGHYCFLAVDGRQSISDGMSLTELASFMEGLGCRRAYNLDGGNSAVMTYQGEICSSPSQRGGRDISDILYVATDTYSTKKKG